MTEALKAFLIALAEDPKKLAKYLKDPRGEGKKAGLIREEMNILMTRNPDKIFAQLQEIGRGIFLWICSPEPRPPKPGVRISRKAVARRRR